MKVTTDGFEATYNKYKNTVYSVIFNYVHNVDDTSDLSQDVFLKLLDCNKEFESEEHLKAWIIKVYINHCKNHFRFLSRFSDEEIPESIYYDNSHEDRELLRAVMSLPEKYRVPLHLFYYEDYTIKQIGDILGSPEATIKIRLKRGREKLKKVIEGKG
jgi:RNA polymerase sigma factor (sigma-70 family)